MKEKPPLKIVHLQPMAAPPRTHTQANRGHANLQPRPPWTPEEAKSMAARSRARRTPKQTLSARFAPRKNCNSGCPYWDVCFLKKVSQAEYQGRCAVKASDEDTRHRLLTIFSAIQEGPDRIHRVFISVMARLTLESEASRDPEQRRRLLRDLALYVDTFHPQPTGAQVSVSVNQSQAQMQAQALELPEALAGLPDDQRHIVLEAAADASLEALRRLRPQPLAARPT